MLYCRHYNWLKSIMSLNWLKALHVIFMVTWFAGLFYLPRLFVYHSQQENSASFALFEVMEKRLFSIMTIGAVLTVIFGFLTMLGNAAYYLSSGWMHAKLLLVALLCIYHCWCWRLMQSLKAGSNQHSHKWYRYFNEAPTLALFGIVILVLVKPGF